MPDLPPDHQGFIDAHSALSGNDATKNPRPRPGSIALAVPRYLKSEDFKTLAPGTRAARRRLLDEIRENHGRGLVRHLQSKHVEKVLKKFSGHARNNRLKVWRAFGKWIAAE